MNRFNTRIRIAHLVLAALLALPLAPSALPVEGKNRSRIVTRTFSNTAEIFVPYGSQPGPVAATVYPSRVVVRDLKGPIRDVNVRLHNLDHAIPEEVRVLLVAPNGRSAVLLADVGKGDAASEVTLRLDDEAGEPLPETGTLSSGAFRPTNAAGSAVAFLNPAPPTTGNAALSVFDGSNPNGTWRLFVQDQNASNPGYVKDGWTLEITAKVKGKKKR